MKRFNTTGTCIPTMHYMVDISEKLNKIIELIDRGEYFTINRSRQFGKTTTLLALEQTLNDRMEVLSISFEGIGEEPFSSNAAFVKTFVELCNRAFAFTNIEEKDVIDWNEIDKESPFKWLSDRLSNLCKKYNILLMVDEMDKCSENQVFLNFLAMLREKYLNRNAGKDYTFKSVILAGVYDVKNLKIKLRPNEERKYNSPWNIAVDFNIDMSFRPKEIANMLEVYESDIAIEMDIDRISQELYYYTNGYPYLVSWLCKWIEEQGNRNWSSDGIKSAVKAYYYADSTLKDDLIKNYENNAVLRNILDSMILEGREFSFVSTDEAVNLGLTFGIFKRSEQNKLEIFNIIFTNVLTEHVVFKAERQNKSIIQEKSQFIKADGHLDMIHVLNRFQAFMKSEYREADERFVESQGRLLFLCFLRPIINGTGFYYVEPQTRNNSRMDIVVTYLDEEFIIELKIWHGEKYRKAGIKQLLGYLDSREQEKGYLVSFSFLKNKEYTASYITDIEDIDETGKNSKEIYEIVV